MLRKLVLGLVFINLVFVFLILGEPKNPGDVKSSASSIFNFCGSLSIKEHCYADKFYELAKNTNLEYATSTLFALQDIDPKNALGCHFISHKIAIAETEKNPDKWQDVLKRVKPYVCTGGFVHGVLEARLTKDPSFRITGDTVNLICDKILNDHGFSEKSCYHVMGHLLMVENAGIIDKSANSCEVIKDEGNKFECLSGVFMENLTREGLVGHGLAQPLPWSLENTAVIEKLCKTYTGLWGRACWKEISYMYAALYDSVPKDLFSACNRAPDSESQTNCYIYGLGNMINNSNFKDSNLESACDVYAKIDPRFKVCKYQIIGSLLATSEKNLDKALTVCAKMESQKSLCYSYLLDILKNNSSAQTFQNACPKIPAGFSDGKCSKV